LKWFQKALVLLLETSAGATIHEAKKFDCSHLPIDYNFNRYIESFDFLMK
jgi:hypothetical protein